MISPAPVDPIVVSKHEISPNSAPKLDERGNSRLSDLRGVQWRINLGILPAFASIDELRRVTADTRRRYASVRRRLLIDPHVLKDGSSSPDLVMDNPLSQNPDSMWKQFFSNAELEKMVDTDLSRLYPEHGSYFQTSACQGILRRILLLWSLKHPEYGYRQGMHELLAPLLYVLHVDVQHVSEVRKVYEHHFNDKFDDMSFGESDLVCNYRSLKLASEIEDRNSSRESVAKASNLEDLDPETQSIVLLTDAYGAEGELGILLSERFMEHDAYCMFDALMGGNAGAVAMAEYFSPAPSIRSNTGLPPVIEASTALYHLLSIVDSSLHSHLVELGVEPQYFALRWLRVLFGREFVLEDLLIIWDEMFSSENGKSSSCVEDEDCSFEILQSPRGAFIAGMAVTMMLHLRSSLLATETATSCLKRLLNFPENSDVNKLIEKAKSLQSLALESNICCPPVQSGPFARSKSAIVRGHSLSTGSVSPKTPLNMIPESYWEEKWRVLHKEEAQQGSTGKNASSGKKKLSERIKLGLGRADSVPTHLKIKSAKEPRASVRRSLLDDLSKELGSEDVNKEDDSEANTRNKPYSRGGQVEERRSPEDTSKINGIKRDFSSVEREASPSGHMGSEETSPDFSASSSPRSSKANERENDSITSSVASNSSVDLNDGEPDNEACGQVANEPRGQVAKEPHEQVATEPPHLVSDSGNATLEKPESNAQTTGKQPGGRKDQKPPSGRFPWLWRFGKNAGDAITEKGGPVVVPRSLSMDNNQKNVSSSNGCSMSAGDTVDKNMKGTLKSLGQSMLENLQVIESALQKDIDQVGSVDNSSKNILVGKGQVTAVSALKELRKISNLLSEM